MEEIGFHRVGGWRLGMDCLVLGEIGVGERDGGELRRSLYGTLHACLLVVTVQ